MPILRTGKDDRSVEQRLADEAVRTRAEVHGRLRLPGEDKNADPVTHIAGCEGCLKFLREHAGSCSDAVELLLRAGGRSSAPRLQAPE